MTVVLPQATVLGVAKPHALTDEQVAAVQAELGKMLQRLGSLRAVGVRLGVKESAAQSVISAALGRGRTPKGERTRPGLKLAHALCRELGVSLDDLVRGDTPERKARAIAERLRREGMTVSPELERDFAEIVASKTTPPPPLATEERKAR